MVAQLYQGGSSVGTEKAVILAGFLSARMGLFHVLLPVTSGFQDIQCPVPKVFIGGYKGSLVLSALVV